jgi:hypothetical protein
MKKQALIEAGKRTPTSVRLSGTTRRQIHALRAHLLHCTAAYAIAWAVEQAFVNLPKTPGTGRVAR